MRNKKIMNEWSIFINDNNYFYKIQFSIFDNSIYLLSYNSLFFWLPSRYLFISDKIEISDNIPKIPDLIVPFYDKESGIIFGNLNYYTNELVYINFNDHSHHNFISTFRYFHHLKNTNSSIGNYIILSSLLYIMVRIANLPIHNIIYSTCNI